MSLSTFNEHFYVIDSLIYHRSSKFQRRQGKRAGHLARNGYWVICLNSVKYAAHRVLYQFYHGIENLHPAAQIDHVNGVKTDNREINLREATVAQNRFNSTLRSDNLIGIKGLSSVFRHRYTTAEKRYWRGRVTVAGKELVRLFEYTNEGKACAVEWLATTRASKHGPFARN